MFRGAEQNLDHYLAVAVTFSNAFRPGRPADTGPTAPITCPAGPGASPHRTPDVDQLARLPRTTRKIQTVNRNPDCNLGEVWAIFVGQEHAGHTVGRVGLEPTAYGLRPIGWLRPWC